MTDKTILIVGATGIVGAAAIEHYANQPGWQVLALSRRPVPESVNVKHLRVDLTDATACRQVLASAKGVTHILYAALFEKPNLVAGWQDSDQIEVNLSMLRNLLDAVEPVATGLRHITILQGTKAYGMHAAQVPVPAKERWPRAGHEIFYWQQEDLLRQRQRGAGWSFTVLRPQLILGNAVGSPMNVVAAIGVYAVIMRELGRGLAFPGGGRYVHAASDSRLIARAVEFSGCQPVAANETFNVVNGDVLVWQDVWPAIAAHFGMSLAEPRSMRLASEMPQFENIWASLVKRHALQPFTMAQLLSSSWQFTDRSFGYGLESPFDRIVSPIKFRKAGFDHCEDTEDNFVYWLRRMQDAKLLPK